MTLREFYAHRLHFRNLNENLLFYAGKLFQEYCVTSYAKVEANNLNWHKNHQKDLRVEEYQGLRDYIARRQNNLNAEVGVGRMFVLPSTYRVLRYK